MRKVVVQHNQRNHRKLHNKGINRLHHATCEDTIVGPGDEVVSSVVLKEKKHEKSCRANTTKGSQRKLHNKGINRSHHATCENITVGLGGEVVSSVVLNGKR